MTPFFPKYLISLIIAGVCLSPDLTAQGIEAQASKKGLQNTSTPLQEVGSIGAPTTGPLIEGVLGSIQKGCRYRFYCHSAPSQEGFLGHKTKNIPLSLKNQPGIFPAPVMGPASLTFSFCCENLSGAITPIVVKPDGSIFKGYPLDKKNSPQTIVIASPAQTGIYTLFAAAHQKDPVDVKVNAGVSHQSQETKVLKLRTFDPNDKNPELASVEFIYTQTN